MKKCKNEYVIYDDYAEIIITNKSGEVYVTKIDVDDIDKCKARLWYVNKKYVTSFNKNTKSPRRLHRFLLNVTDKDIYIDHIDTDTLNNRKNNLRICDPQQNSRNTQNRTPGKNNVIIGVRKDSRDCKKNDSWVANLYFKQKELPLSKTYRYKDLAILRRLTWELMYFEEFAPQMNLIRSDYPYLLGYLKVKDKMTFTDDMETILAIGNKLKEDLHCPCTVVKNEYSVCPCIACREKQFCHCGMFIKNEDAKIQNKRNDNTSGYTGVYWHKHLQKWYASITTSKKTISLGYYTNKEDAINARKDAEEKYH